MSFLLVNIKIKPKVINIAADKMISLTTPSLNIKLTIAVSIIALPLKISSKPIM